MSIYIRGMEMPKDGEMKVLCIGYNGKVLFPIDFLEEDMLYQDSGKTAIELPEHGRLIDADALVKNAVDFYDPYGIISGVTLDEIDDAPTIIPASGGVEA